MPAGRSARCGYHIFIAYSAFPLELPAPEKIEADLNKNGISTSHEAVLARRDELSYLVGLNIWRRQERLGPSGKGSYARVNYDKIKPGETAE